MNSRISKIENPIRGELFSLERLETHAESLAIAQQITVKSTKSRKLLPRVKENGRILTAGYRAIAQAVREERAIAGGPRPGRRGLFEFFDRDADGRRNHDAADVHALSTDHGEGKPTDDLGDAHDEQ